MEAASGSAPPPPRVAWRGILGAAAGVLVALATGTQAELAPLIMVCSTIYLGAAATGRRWAAWAGFAASGLVLTPGFVLDAPWIPLVALLVVQAALVIVGLRRGAFAEPAARAQLYGAAGFGVLAVAATVGAGAWAGVLTVLGLLGHGAWDLWHHRADAVVPRSYALFCAALDVVLALLVAWALVSGR
ncbi:hypothetical protein [Brachybacterium hainanense]|uniref:DUF4203 domain-containing protein n=1 Tax=Brachybacterium hainanense TaxID=1541174 RepID=A0ABV6RAH7_9MICO